MKILKFVLFGVGFVLLLITVFGLFKSLRNPAIYDEKSTPYINDITVTLMDAKKEAKRKPGESDKDLVVRINSLVNKGTAYYMRLEGAKKYNLRIPVWENYILFAASKINPKRYGRYEFANYKKNFERGVGLCSTHAIIAKGILNNNGIDADLLDLTGHVVVRAKVDKDNWYVIDPTIGGIVIPYDMNEIEANPEIIRDFYKNRLHLYREKPTHFDSNNDLVKYYGKEGNKIYTMDRTGRFENFSYAAIWILPILLMLPLLFEFGKLRKNIRE
jgi:hypothetical protein